MLFLTTVKTISISKYIQFIIGIVDTIKPYTRSIFYFNKIIIILQILSRKILFCAFSKFISITLLISCSIVKKRCINKTHVRIYFGSIKMEVLFRSILNGDKYCRMLTKGYLFLIAIVHFS